MRRPGESWIEDIAKTILALGLYCGIIAGAGYAAYTFFTEFPLHDKPQMSAPASPQKQSDAGALTRQAGGQIR